MRKLKELEEINMNLRESIRRILKEETQGIDGFLNRITSKFPETELYIDKIKSFIEDSNCKKVEVGKFKYPALGLALHNGVLFNEMIFYQTLPNFLFIIFHEMAHQYQYKKYGDEKMYEFYLGEIDVKDAAIAMKQIEMTADEFASRKVREFVKLGLISQPNFPALSQYKNIPLNHFENLINKTKESIKEKGVTSFDEVAELFYNMVKINEVVSTTKAEQTEGEITERCWKGYTQKGMKTMFGKRYPNCVKKKK